MSGRVEGRPGRAVGDKLTALSKKRNFRHSNNFSLIPFASLACLTLLIPGCLKCWENVGVRRQINVFPGCLNAGFGGNIQKRQTNA